MTVGFLEVGLNDAGEVVINHPDLKPDAKGVGHIVFSLEQARNLARLLLRHADASDNSGHLRSLTQSEKLVVEEAARVHRDSMPDPRGLRLGSGDASIPPVDRAARVLVDGSPVTDDHREINPATGMQKDYVVLTAEERAKGFVRSVRTAYIHVGAPPEGEDYSRFAYPIRGAVKAFPGGCLARTQMNRAIAETYARDPQFYGATFCFSCGTHRPLTEFIWEGTTERVGS